MLKVISRTLQPTLVQVESETDFNQLVNHLVQQGYMIGKLPSLQVTGPATIAISYNPQVSAAMLSKV